MVASRLANMQEGGDRKSEDFKTEISALISQPEAAAMVASRLANMQQGARTDIAEISVMS